MPTLLAERHAGSFDLTPLQVRIKQELEILSRAAQQEFRKGLQALRSGRIEEAEAHFWQVLLVHPDYPPALYNLGVVLRRRGENDEALKRFHQALKVRPDYPEALNNVGCVLSERHLYKQALPYFRNALQQRPNDADVCLNMGVTLALLGQIKQAERYCRDGLKLAPDSALGHNNLGIVLARQGRTQEAAESYHKALALKPDLAHAFNNLGVLYYEKQQVPEAEENYRKALALQPNFPTVRANLGELLSTTDRTIEAMQEFEMAYPERAQIPDGGNDLYRAWAVMLLREGAKATTARDIRASEQWTDKFLDLQRRAEKDGMLGSLKEAMSAVRASLSKETMPALDDFLLGVKLLAIEDPWEGWDALAREVSKRWPKDLSAVDAIREQRD